MNLTVKKIILVVLCLLLAAEIGLVFLLGSPAGETAVETDAPTLPKDTLPVMTDTVTEPTETLAPTQAPTEAPTEPPETEPKEIHYTLSFAGDCTLGSTKANWSNPNHFVTTIGENYDYPFANVRKYFENDDFTIINLEGPLTDSSSGAQSKTFAFRGPTAYSAIMTGSSVQQLPAKTLPGCRCKVSSVLFAAFPTRSMLHSPASLRIPKSLPDPPWGSSWNTYQ